MLLFPCKRSLFQACSVHFKILQRNRNKVNSHMSAMLSTLVASEKPVFLRREFQAFAAWRHCQCKLVTAKLPADWLTCDLYGPSVDHSIHHLPCINAFELKALNRHRGRDREHPELPCRGMVLNSLMVQQGHAEEWSVNSSVQGFADRNPALWLQ